MQGLLEKALPEQGDTECELSREALYTVQGISAQEALEEHERRQYQKEITELLDWALDKLSPEDRTVLVLTCLEERSMEEAAQLMGISKTNAKVRAYRARKRLKSILTKVMEGRT